MISTMHLNSFYFVCVLLCCLHVTSEPLHYAEEYKTNNDRKRRSDEKDGLTISKEIFRNISKQLRENIKRESSTDKSDRLHQSTKTSEDSRQWPLYQTNHHHEHHWGPYFEDIPGERTDGYIQVKAHEGAEALLSCRVGMLKDKTVMWVRKTLDPAPHLLTVGLVAYSGDNRVGIKFQYPHNWRLSINPVKNHDAGVYMCQISTHPPRTIYTNLTVLAPLVTINGDKTHELKDRFYKSGSSINLTCTISEDFISSVPMKKTKTTMLPATTPTSTTTQLTTKTSTVFNRIDLVLNKSWSVETTTISSTVSISTTTKLPVFLTTPVPISSTQAPEVNNVFGLVWKKQGKDLLKGITWQNLSATFNVVTASQNDSGAYSCHLQNHSVAVVNVHVLIGENQAAVHHDTLNNGHFFKTSKSLILHFVLTAILVNFTSL